MINIINSKTSFKYSHFYIILLFAIFCNDLSAYVQSFYDKDLQYINPQNIEFIFENQLPGQFDAVSYYNNQVFLNNLNQEVICNQRWKNLKSLSENFP